MAEGNGGCVAGALLVLGLLILVPSGLCTGIFALGPLVEMLSEPRATSSDFEMLPAALMFGGPFILVGALMVWGGLRGLRRKKAPPAIPPDLTPPG